MTWRGMAIALHRDLGYFFVGATVLFAISGLAVNHARDWDPDFAVSRHAVVLDLPEDPAAIDDGVVRRSLLALETVGTYRTHDYPSTLHLKIYLEDGSILVNLQDGTGEYETVRRRPVLYELNRLHLDPARWWLVFSDTFAVGLIILAITGMVMLRGRHGFMKRGKWLVAGGLIAPILGFFATT